MLKNLLTVTDGIGTLKAVFFDLDYTLYDQRQIVRGRSPMWLKPSPRIAARRQLQAPGISLENLDPSGYRLCISIQ